MGCSKHCSQAQLLYQQEIVNLVLQVAYRPWHQACGVAYVVFRLHHRAWSHSMAPGRADLE